MNRKISGYFTVEASILFPTLIYVIFILMFLLTYIYDCILLLQDMNAMEASYKISERDFYYLYKEITEEHPYIMSDGIKINIENEGKHKRVTICCNWKMPLIADYNKEIIIRHDISAVNPLEIMRVTRSLTQHKEEEINDTYESSQ